jgi:hypothetical protein
MHCHTASKGWQLVKSQEEWELSWCAGAISDDHPSNLAFSVTLRLMQLMGGRGHQAKDRTEYMYYDHCLYIGDCITDR